MDRRQLLRFVPPFLIASSAPSLWSPALAAKVKFLAALLVPKSGPHAALGRSMERAALLAQGTSDPKALMVFDTGGNPAGAAAAARAARKTGASVILGPVLASEVAPALAAAGPGAPVLAFSNDAQLLDRGAFLLGLTATQVVGSIMAYAARRGIRRFAIGSDPGTWGEQVQAAALKAATALGVHAYALPVGRVSTLTQSDDGSGDGLPDAVLMSSTGGLLAIAPAAAAMGVQMLGAMPTLDLSGDELARLDGTWLAAPDPARFATFARAFEERNGTRPGLIAGLAYDAVRIVQQLRLAGGADRSGLLVPDGFKAVCGDVRFRDDGSAARALAILAVTTGGLRTIAPQAFG